MAVIHRALFTWFSVLVFLILLVLRLDRKVEWNWFLIFIPMWLFDSVVIIYITVNMIIHCKNEYRTSHHDLTMTRKGWFMAAVILKLAFQVLLCLKNEYFNTIPLYYVMIPFWTLMVGSTGDIFAGLLSSNYRRWRYEACPLRGWISLGGQHRIRHLLSLQELHTVQRLSAWVSSPCFGLPSSLVL